MLLTQEVNRLENNDNLVTVDQLAELARRSDERFIDKEELAEVEQAINTKVRVEVDPAQQTLVFML